MTHRGRFVRSSVVACAVAATLGTLLLPTSRAWAVPSARSIDTACAPDVPEASFEDVEPGNVHSRAIDCLLFREVTQGTGDNRYRPGDPVTRGQIASLIARLIEEAGGSLPAGPADAFEDDDGSVHETNINKVAAAGVVKGKDKQMYDPSSPVTRGQIGSVLVRAIELGLTRPLLAGGDQFLDDDGDAHEADINKAAAAGIAVGFPDGSYRPGASVLRDQAATFLTRSLDLIETTEIAWEDAIGLIRSCQVASASQTHDRRVWLGLKDGTSRSTIEPRIDAIGEEIQQAEPTCGPVMLATE